jgi:hypothetical protein
LAFIKPQRDTFRALVAQPVALDMNLAKRVMTIACPVLDVLNFNLKQLPLMQESKLCGANGVQTVRKHSNSLRLVQRKPLSSCDDSAFREGAVYSANCCQ